MDSTITLTDRKKRILEFIVSEHIETAEPVGSRTISQNKELGISAATVRNEMSDLEKLGLLLQPHTSAGRIPSAEAYELYARELLLSNKIQPEDYKDLKSFFSNVNQITNLIEESLNILTKITNYTAVAISQKTFTKQVIKQINIVRISKIEVVIVIVFESGEVKNAITPISPRMTDEAIAVVGSKMNESLTGMDISGISIDLLALVKQSVARYSREFDEITRELREVLAQEQTIEMALTGATNMFDHPEFHSIDKAKSFMEFLSSKKEVQRLFNTQGIKKDDINIVIGNEKMGEVAKDVSIISANLNYDGSVIGKIGIIAPRRMDYNKAFTIVSFIQSQINSIINDT